MPKEIIALAAIVLAGGIAAAAAQTGVPPNGGPPGARITPDTVPLAPYIHNPKVNPSAAGTLREGEMRSPEGVLEETERYGGSREINPNTHPLKSLRARQRMRGQDPTPPSVTGSTPRGTADTGAGR